MAERVEKIQFTKDEVKDLMFTYNTKKPEKALEEWAYRQYDLRHNASIYIKKTGKTFIEIGEMP